MNEKVAYEEFKTLKSNVKSETLKELVKELGYAIFGIFDKDDKDDDKDDKDDKDDDKDDRDDNYLDKFLIFNKDDKGDDIDDDDDDDDGDDDDDDDDYSPNGREERNYKESIGERVNLKNQSKINEKYTTVDPKMNEIDK